MNNIPTEINLTCSTEELFTMASLLGGEMLIGVPDPFPGWLTEEIAEVMTSTQIKLAERGFLAIHPDGHVEMDVGTAALVGTLAAPQAVFILTLTIPENTPTQIMFYHRAPVTVFLEKNGDSWDLHTLSSPEDIFNRIEQNWRLDGQKVIQSGVIVIPQSFLQSIQDAVVSGMESIQSKLEEAGVHQKKDAQALATTLSSPTLNGALVALRPQQNTWDVGGMGVLAGENGQWLLRTFARQQLDWIEFSPVTVGKIKMELSSILKHYLPSREV